MFALPGNPVSAYMSFEVFVRPVIRRMLGATDVHRPVVRAVCGAALHSPAGRRQFLRGWYSAADATVQPVGGEGSHLVGALAKANCLIIVPEDTVATEAGETVDVVLLTDFLTDDSFRSGRRSPGTADRATRGALLTDGEQPRGPGAVRERGIHPVLLEY